MIRILLFSESRYPVNRKAIREEVVDVLSKKGIVSDVEVSIAIVGDRKIRELNKKYRGKDETTDVLSFSQTEGIVIAQSGNNVLRLGDIVISYPQVLKNAVKKEVLVDQEISSLLLHGLNHLLGEHHDEE